MEPILQWGEYNMIQWSPNVGGYLWTCIWGCYGYDHDTEDQARGAFDSHVCVAQQAEPCS